MREIEKIRKFSDEELDKYLDNKSFLHKDLCDLAISEFQKRSLEKLKKSIDKFNSSSKKYSISIIFLTIVLIIFTAVMAYPVIIDFIAKLKP